MGNNWASLGLPAWQGDRLLPMLPALGELPELAQGPRQPCLGMEPKSVPNVPDSVHRLHGFPQQISRLAKVADVKVCLP